MNKVKSNVTAMPVTRTGAPAHVSTTEITEELLQCRLCATRYRVTGRRPLTLRCAHTFCELCLEHLLRAQDDDGTAPTQRRNQQLECPTCFAVTPLGRGATASSSLPVNHSVMELLEIFDRPASGGRHEPSCAGDLAPGYSQVTVSTKTSHHGRRSNGTINPEPNRTLAALAKNKKDRRAGVDLAGRYLPSGGNVEDSTLNATNWVSTVNIGKSSSPQLQHHHQQHQKQQQQQHGSSLSAGKLSTAPAAVTSAVTSVSTLKPRPQQLSTTSSGVVQSSDGNVDCPAAAAAAVAGVPHRCGRCGVRAATVSVASSSQTKAPQKLCSDCRNRPKDDDDRKPPGTAKERTVTTITENGSSVTARVSTTKADARSGGGAAATPPTKAAVPRTTTVDSSGTAKRKDGGDHEGHAVTAATSLVANGTSTIEVRRRSQYLDNRSRAAPIAATPDTPGTGSGTVDRPAQSSTAASASSVPAGPHQTSATIVEQHPTNARRSACDVQPGTAPESAPEALSTGSGSNSTTGRNTSNHGKAKELDEQGDAQKVSSAPNISDIHPLPCSNPPYNPDFEEDRNAAWSSTQPHTRRPTDASPADRLNPTPSEPRSQDQRHRVRQMQEISETTGNRLALSFLMSNSACRYPPEQPPKYEDIIRDDDAAVVSSSAPEAPDAPAAAAAATSTDAAGSAPVPPAAAMKLVRSFGKYGEISTQPGAFRAPSRLSVAAARDAAETRVVVGDAANGTVQVFGETGECLSMLRADAVRGCCLLDDNRRLLLAVDRAVEVSQPRPRHHTPHRTQSTTVRPTAADATAWSACSYAGQTGVPCKKWLNHGRQRHWNIGSQVERRRRENRGTVGGEGSVVWGGALPIPRKFMNVSSQNGVIWCILGVLFLRFMCHENDSDLRCSEVPLKGKKYNTCQNIGRQHRTTPVGQILGGRDPCNPCGVDAYGLNRSRCRLGEGRLAAQRTMYVGVQVGATKRIQLNGPCTAAMGTACILAYCDDRINSGKC